MKDRWYMIHVKLCIKIKLCDYIFFFFFNLCSWTTALLSVQTSIPFLGRTNTRVQIQPRSRNLVSSFSCLKCLVFLICNISKHGWWIRLESDLQMERNSKMGERKIGGSLWTNQNSYDVSWQIFNFPEIYFKVSGLELFFAFEKTTLSFWECTIRNMKL